MNNFNFKQYINDTDITDIVPRQDTLNESDNSEDFKSICEKINAVFFADWSKNESSRSSLEIQKRAIIGYEKEKNFFKERIAKIIDEGGLYFTDFPSWYPSLEEAIYQENWGMAGLSEWFSEKYAQSSSAKIIGERIYFMQNGRMKLMPQTISRKRADQLIKAFLLLTPQERMDRDYYETYLLDGTRVTVFTQPMAKEGQTSLIFRRYLVPNLTFEEQANRGTIPFSAIPLFKDMVGLGFNVVFLGAVRTAKTTFLSTWQSYEDPTLEGVMVETDPEIPMHKLLPKAPIVQLIADGEELTKISKNLLRSDADYFILAEARDGIALDTAVKLAAKGTKRMKMTFHSRIPEHFPLEAATEIIKSTGGDLRLTMQMVASGFDFLFHFIQLSDKSQKRLKGIYKMSLSSDAQIDISPLCLYDCIDNSWTFYEGLCPTAEEYAKEVDPVLLQSFKEKLHELAVQGKVV